MPQTTTQQSVSWRLARTLLGTAEEGLYRQMLLRLLSPEPGEIVLGRTTGLGLERRREAYSK